MHGDLKGIIEQDMGFKSAGAQHLPKLFAIPGPQFRFGNMLHQLYDDVEKPDKSAGTLPSPVPAMFAPVWQFMAGKLEAVTDKK